MTLNVVARAPGRLRKSQIVTGDGRALGRINARHVLRFASGHAAVVPTLIGSTAHG
jgi:hypothetical protein